MESRERNLQGASAIGDDNGEHAGVREDLKAESPTLFECRS